MREKMHGLPLENDVIKKIAFQLDRLPMKARGRVLRFIESHNEDRDLERLGSMAPSGQTQMTPPPMNGARIGLDLDE